MNQSKTCPLCGYENPTNAALCARCQAPLGALLPTRITEHTPDVEQVVSSRRKQYFGQIPPNVLGLQVSTREEPFFIQVEKELVLGRDSATSATPLFDLTPYGAAALGVSRQHVLIRRTEKGFTVKDFGSTNGSWLNGTRLSAHQLYELANGDQLRLAQLTLYVYVTSDQQVIESRFCLRGGTADLAMSPDHLINVVGPYLRTVAGIQAIVDTLKDRKSAGTFVRSINAETAAICIKMTGVAEALQIIETTVNNWRRRHRASQSVGDVTLESRAINVNQNAEPLVSDMIAFLPEQDKALGELAAAVVKQIAPQLDPTSEEGKAAAARLLPHLRILAYTTLSIVH